MPDIMSLLGNSAQGQAPQGQLQAQPQPQQPTQQQPAPTPGQTAAALHHFSEIKSMLKPIMADPNLGKTNIRPKLLDSMSKLLASRALSLPQVMNAVKSLPDDPVEQLKFVQKVYQDNDAAQKLVLMHSRNAANASESPTNEDPYSADNHAAMMDGLLKQYMRDK